MNLTPWIAPDVIAWLDKKLPPLKPLVFEWGSGASTNWFADRCARVISVEHDKAWACIAIRAAKPNVELHYIPLDSTNYVTSIINWRYIRPLVVFIDGRKRTDCAKVTATIEPDVIIFDDSERERYKEALELLASCYNRIYKRFEYNAKDPTNPAKTTSLFIHSIGPFWKTL